MKATMLLSALFAVYASAGVVPRNAYNSDREVIRALLENPSLLPPSSMFSA
jgi:hypothetical protein